MQWWVCYESFEEHVDSENVTKGDNENERCCFCLEVESMIKELRRRVVWIAAGRVCRAFVLFRA